MTAPDAGALAHKLKVATAIARDAGEILREGWGARPRFRTKSSAIDLVTEFDERSEALVVSRLRAAFPGDHIVGEEGARIAGETGAPTWYIDPLDGTANFTHGVPVFSVSIGLAAAGTGTPLLGVVHAPVLDMCFAGAPSLGAFRNDEPIAVSAVEELQAAMLATGFPAGAPAHDNFAEFMALTGNVHGTRRLGSAALDLAFVASGWFDGFWERHVKAWDLVGGAALVLAAGGRVTDLDEGRFQGETGRALATNGHIHAALGEVLRTVAQHTGAPWPG